jgi:hypothetical protein
MARSALAAGAWEGEFMGGKERLRQSGAGLSTRKPERRKKKREPSRALNK